MKLFKNKGNNKGFSLVELIVVVAIMAVLLGVLALNLIPRIESSRLGKDKDSLDKIQGAVVIALAKEGCEDFTLTLNATKGEIDLTKLPDSVKDSVKDTLGFEKVKLVSKLKDTASTITITVKDGVCVIKSTDKTETKLDKYEFQIPDGITVPEVTTAAPTSSAS